jgi:hypothetical protein
MPMMPMMTTSTVLQNSQLPTTNPANPVYPSLEPVNDISLSEIEALNLLNKYGLTVSSLRDDAQSGGMTKKQDGEWFYSHAYIDDLISNWTTKQRAASSMQMTDKQFWHWLHASKCPRKLIGKVSLVKSSVVFEAIQMKFQKGA